MDEFFPKGLFEESTHLNIGKCMRKEFLNNTRATSSPPPAPTKKKSRKTLLLILLAILLIVIIAVGAFIAMGGLNNSNNTTTPTPTPSGNPTPTNAVTTTPAPTSSVTGADIAGASNLQYSVDVTSGGVSQGSYTYYGKNAGTMNFMMRVDYTDDTGAQGSFIINSAQQKAWSYSDGVWTDISEAYSVQYDTWNTLWQGYIGNLGAWNGIGDYTYSSGGDSVRFYGISVNPSLPDSLFTPS
jgi:hypothetical protein